MDTPNTPPTLTILPSGNEQGAPAQSAVEAATAAALARVEQTGTALPADPARGPDGKFVEPGRIDHAREVGTPKPQAGQAAPADDPAATEGQEPPASPTPADGQQAAEAGAEPEAVEEGAPETAEQKAAREAAERTIVFNGRNNEEFELELPADTPKEVVEAVRGLRNQVMRTEEIKTAREEIAQRSQELEQTVQSIEMDPVGFVLSVVEDEPAITLKDGTSVDLAEHTVLSLLTHPKLFDKLRDRVAAIVSDETELRIARGEVKAQRGDIREEARTAAEERVVVSRNLQDVQATVGAILPTDWPEDRQRVLYADCMRELKDYADRHNLLTIQPKDIPAILSHRLYAYGINPAEAATRAAETVVRRDRRPAPRPASGPARQTPAPRPAAPPPSGKRFVASARKKGDAAAIPPGGAGSPAGTQPLTPPKKADGSPMGIQETIDWRRAQLRARGGGR